MEIRTLRPDLGDVVLLIFSTLYLCEVGPEFESLCIHFMVSLPVFLLTS